MLASRSLRVPLHISILHVEQEVAGDDTVALQSVLESDTVREELLKEERSLNAHIANGTYVNYSPLYTDQFKYVVCLYHIVWCGRHCAVFVLVYSVTSVWKQFVFCFFVFFNI